MGNVFWHRAKSPIVVDVRGYIRWSYSTDSLPAPHIRDLSLDLL